MRIEVPFEADLFGYTCSAYAVFNNGAYEHCHLKGRDITITDLIYCCLEYDDEMTIHELSKELEAQAKRHFALL